jgi:hypothetical protein
MTPREQVEKELVEELKLLPDYASEYFMKVWNALVASRLKEKENRHGQTPKAV